MIENVSTQLTVFHCFAHCLLPGRAFASLYALLFLEKEAEIGGRAIDAACSGSTLFASIPNLSVMLGNYLQQTTSSDDIFRCIFFFAL